MDLSQATPAPPSGFPFQPLLVAMIGIVATAVVLLCYHFILSKYCTRSPSTTTTSQLQPPKGSGVEEWIINIIPVQNYTKHQDFRKDQSQCAVCLAELEEGEQVRILPNCRHDFHVQCIDEWFISHSNCPLCRSPILPTPPEVVATPGTEGESEVTTQSPSKDPAALLRPCASSVLPCERKPPAVLLGAPKRSFSMDVCSYVSLRTEYDLTRSSSSSSSLPSSKLPAGRTQSQKRLDRGSPMLNLSDEDGKWWLCDRKFAKVKRANGCGPRHGVE